MKKYLWILLLIIGLGSSFTKSPLIGKYSMTAESIQPKQSLFSHTLHAGEELDISCMYCHSTQKNTTIARFNPCFNCHSIITNGLDKYENDEQLEEICKRIIAF